MAELIKKLLIEISRLGLFLYIKKDQNDQKSKSSIFNNANFIM